MVQSIGFRFIFVVLASLAGLCALIGIPFLRETYTPVIRARLAKRLAFDVEATVLEQPGKNLFTAPPPPKPETKDVLLTSLTRPVVLLSTSFICFILSLFMALYVLMPELPGTCSPCGRRIYGFLYLLFTTFPTLFAETYGWGPGVSGLVRALWTLPAAP